jgi:excinuclease ABC subunit C
MRVIDGAIVHGITIELKRKLDEPMWRCCSSPSPNCANATSSATEAIVPFDPDRGAGPHFTVPQRGDKKHLLELCDAQRAVLHDRQAEAGIAVDPEAATTRILEQLKQDLRLSELPRHIECFDNSNTQGTDPVSACVVFKDAKPSKKDYRHFNIRTVEGPDDFASMEEAVERRYARLHLRANRCHSSW